MVWQALISGELAQCGDTMRVNGRMKTSKSFHQLCEISNALSQRLADAARHGLEMNALTCSCFVVFSVAKKIPDVQKAVLEFCKIAKISPV